MHAGLHSVNQEQMDSHSLASKVNREVCQLKASVCLLNAPGRFDFTVRDEDEEEEERRGRQHSPCFFLVCSLGGSRGQDLIRQLSYQFTKLLFDEGQMKPVVLILRSVQDSPPPPLTSLVEQRLWRDTARLYRACKFYWWIMSPGDMHTSTDAKFR